MSLPPQGLVVCTETTRAGTKRSPQASPQGNTSNCWVAMVHDFAMWRDDLPFVRSLMPGVRSVMEAHLAQLTEGGLSRWIDGWNYADWVPGWRSGIPPATEGTSGVHHWQMVYILNLWAELEEMLGEGEMDQHARRCRDAMAGAGVEAPL